MYYEIHVEMGTLSLDELASIGGQVASVWRSSVFTGKFDPGNYFSARATTRLEADGLLFTFLRVLRELKLEAKRYKIEYVCLDSKAP